MQTRRNVLALSLPAIFLATSAHAAYWDECGEISDDDENGCPPPSVPEIDGATLPKAVLLLVSLYLFFKYRRRAS